MRTAVLAALTMLAATAAPSHGADIQDWFTGRVTSVTQWGPTVVTDIFHVNDPVWGLLTYSTTPDWSNVLPESAIYKYNPAGVYGLSIATGGYTFATVVASPRQFELDIRNDDLAPPSTRTDDVYAAGWRIVDLPGSPGLIYGGEIEESIYVIQESSSSLPTLVTSSGVSLPFSLNLGSADSATGYILSTNAFADGYRIEFDITDFGAVPEPGSLALLLAGSGFLAAWRRFRR